MATPNMLMDLPVDGDTDDLWGVVLNDALEDRVDVHDHTTGLGVKVPVAGLRINADLSFLDAAVNYSLKDLRAVDFTPVTAASVAAFSSACFVDSADNNLKFRNAAGVVVGITNGNTLNASIIGGIGGDYASVGALVDYVDLNDTYRFRQQVGAAVQQFARMQSADLDVYEYKAHPAAGVPTNRIRLKSPAALGASYDVTLWAATPASQKIVQMDATGALTASNSLALNESITLSGTGDILHGDWTIPAAPHGGRVAAGAFGVDVSGNPAATGVGDRFQWTIPTVRTGDLIKSMTVSGLRVGGTITVRFVRVPLATGVAVVVSTANIAAGGLFSQLLSPNYTLLSTEVYYLEFLSGAAGDVLYGAMVTAAR
jgi:hypothetical protein